MEKQLDSKIMNITLNFSIINESFIDIQAYLESNIKIPLHVEIEKDEIFEMYQKNFFLQKNK